MSSQQQHLSRSTFHLVTSIFSTVPIMKCAGETTTTLLCRFCYSTVQIKNCTVLLFWTKPANIVHPITVTSYGYLHHSFVGVWICHCSLSLCPLSSIQQISCCTQTNTLQNDQVCFLDFVFRSSLCDLTKRSH